MLLMHFLDYPLLMMNKKLRWVIIQKGATDLSMFCIKNPIHNSSYNFLNPVISLHQQLQQGSLDHSLYSCVEGVLLYMGKIYLTELLSSPIGWHVQKTLIRAAEKFYMPGKK